MGRLFRKALTIFRARVKNGLFIKKFISHINYWDQVNSWKNLWKFWNGPLCRNKSSPFPLLNVAEDWQSSDNKACAKKLSQILANNIDHKGGDWSQNLCEVLSKTIIEKKGFEKAWIFFTLNSLFLMFGICQMVLWLLGHTLITLTLKNSSVLGRSWGEGDWSQNLCEVSQVRFVKYAD